MTRRAALATAGAITIVLLAAAAAIATNLGLLRVATDTGPVGDLSTSELAPAVGAQQPAGDAVADDNTGGQVRKPGDDSSADRRSDVEPNDDPTSPANRPPEERYEGRDDDD
jgi:hypothetical protein